MQGDLILYVVIILGLLVWLRNTMGTRHGDEPQHPNPLTHNKDEHPDGLGVNQKDDTRIDEAGFSETTASKDIQISNDDVETGLSAISQADRNFSVAAFTRGAQEAFVIIVEAFAKGDRDTLKPLLNNDVYDAFEKAISDRERNKLTQETEIQAIRKVEVTDAQLHDDMAYVTCRITAQEVSVTRDEDGNVTAGDPDRLYDMTDRWTFGRNIRSRDPVWYLYQTNDDVEESHDSIDVPDAGSKE